jgi:hypothetical protein
MPEYVISRRAQRYFSPVLLWFGSRETARPPRCSPPPRVGLLFPAPAPDKRLVFPSTVTFFRPFPCSPEDAVLYGFSQHVLFGTFISSGHDAAVGGSNRAQSSQA